MREREDGERESEREERESERERMERESERERALNFQPEMCTWVENSTIIISCPIQ